MTAPFRPATRYRDPVTGALLFAAAPLLAAGMTMPAVSIRHFAFFQDTYSLLESIMTFWTRGDVLLFLLLIAFSVLFPALKIVAGLSAWFFSSGQPIVLARLIVSLDVLSRWSMLDVFIVAITVLVADGRLLTSADVHAGVVLFAGAAIASSTATHRLARRIRYEG